MIGVGIIGAGHFGAVHARALAGLGNARLVAACRNDVAGIGRFVAEHGGRAYTDWSALLDDPLSDSHRDLLGQGEQITATHRLQFRKEIGKEGHGRPLL